MTDQEFVDALLAREKLPELLLVYSDALEERGFIDMAKWWRQLATFDNLIIKVNESSEGTVLDLFLEDEPMTRYHFGSAKYHWQVGQKTKGIGKAVL